MVSVCEYVFVRLLLCVVRVLQQDVPVLLTRGEFDEVSQASALQVATALPSSGGQVATFKNSGSYMHIGRFEFLTLFSIGLWAWSELGDLLVWPPHI